MKLIWRRHFPLATGKDQVFTDWDQVDRFADAIVRLLPKHAAAA